MTPDTHTAGPPFDWTLPPRADGWGWTPGADDAPRPRPGSDDAMIAAARTPCLDCGRLNDGGGGGVEPCIVCGRHVCDACWTCRHWTHEGSAACRLPPE